VAAGALVIGAGGLVAGATVGVALQAAITTARRTSIKTRIVFMINFTPLFLKEIGWMGKAGFVLFCR
jgi:hypothetical protein